MIRSISFLAVFALSTGVCLPLALAEDASVVLPRVASHVKGKRYVKALSDIALLQQAVEQLKTEELKRFFPDIVAELKGSSFEASSALGMSNLSRSYKQSETEVLISLVGGGNPGALGGVAGLGRMAAIIKKGRIEEFQLKGFSATFDEEGVHPEISVFLDSGAILKIEGLNSAGLDKLKAVAQALDIVALDRYLSGNPA